MSHVQGPDTPSPSRQPSTPTFSPRLGHASCMSCCGRLCRLLTHVFELLRRGARRLACVPVTQASDAHDAPTVGAWNAVLQHLSIRGHLLRRVALLQVDDGRHPFSIWCATEIARPVARRQWAFLGLVSWPPCRTHCSAASLTAASVSAVKVLLAVDSSKVMGPVTLAVQEGPSWTKMM